MKFTALAICIGFALGRGWCPTCNGFVGRHHGACFVDMGDQSVFDARAELPRLREQWPFAGTITIIRDVKFYRDSPRPVTGPWKIGDRVEIRSVR